MKRAGLLLGGALAAACAPLAASGGTEASAGERAFQKCYACHSLDPGETGLTGPPLRAIVGRRIAAEPGFAYSPAMRAYAARQRRWTREALDAFIAGPQGVVPGNDMGFFGLRDPAERRALIAYLAIN